MLLYFIWIVLSLLELLILVRCVLSFIPPLQRTPSGSIVMAVTEPVLAPFRGIATVGTRGVGIDFSPMIVMVIIHILRTVLPH